MAYDDLVARFTLAGSMTSCIATSLVLLSYFFFRDQQYSFRHALILNLAAAEFINTLNNSISGFIYVRTKKLSPGPACTANGFIGQLTVQAVDFTILAIVLVTLLTITRKTYLPDVSIWAKAIICASTWVVPIITSVVAVSLDAMTPVSGNWCWITAKRPDLRYGLTHGWRIGIIFVTVLLYAYIWWFVHRHFKVLFGSRGGARFGYNPVTGAVHTESARLTKERLEESQGTTLIGEADTGPLSDIRHAPKDLGDSRDDMTMSDFSLPIQGAEDVVSIAERGFVPSVTPPAPTVGHAEGQRSYSRHLAAAESDKPEICPRVRHSVDVRVSIAKRSYSWLPPGITPGGPPGSANPITPHTETKISSTRCSRAAASQNRRHASVSRYEVGHPSRAQKVEREIRRMLLLNAYPTLYVLLWVPGIVNRLMEATGRTPSNPRAVAALQSTSQFVGFANALTFGFNATMRRRVGSAALKARQKLQARAEAWRNV
ncbi:hypothetical protein KVR01_009053 [Diaporthe batatas]|uniref:uncharacterized protein n=1 Tax=Diaporthe batatas TaxID=748121 RepID=UPI001D04F12E|nr:uncharacterized protein KVR01_009053 [Diaporthe batatas]KAG8160789.1 hypothetical protein KVR01_009053 [Diaporthe batatas]